MRFSAKSRFKYTRILVVASMAGSLLTTVTGKFGYGELYPFANWKLFTQPLGSNNLVSEFRIYTLAPEDTTWERQEVAQLYNNFTRDEYSYTLSGLTQAALSGNTDSATVYSRLLNFAKYAAPGAAAYKIVRETYQPLEYLQHPEHYDTLTVIRF